MVLHSHATELMFAGPGLFLAFCQEITDEPKCSPSPEVMLLGLKCIKGFMIEIKQNTLSTIEDNEPVLGAFLSIYCEYGNST